MIQVFKKSIAISWVFCCALLMALYACHSQGMVEEQVSKKPLRVAVLPFKDLSQSFGEGINVRSPISGKIFLTGSIMENACDLLSDQLSLLLKKRDELEVIPAGGVEVALSKVRYDESAISEKNVALKVGNLLGAEGVMVGYVYRFKQRSGTRYAIESPASVAFEVLFLDIKEGRVIWEGHMDETQRSLSENILNLGAFLKRKGRWVTAEEMALSSLEELIQTLP